MVPSQISHQFHWHWCPPYHHRCWLLHLSLNTLDGHFHSHFHTETIHFPRKAKWNRDTSDYISMVHLSWAMSFSLENSTEKSIKYWPNTSEEFSATHTLVIVEVFQLTLTTWFDSVPFWPFAVAHDTRQCGVALQHIASLTMKCHHGSQLVVSTHSSAIHHIPWIKACLPQFCCQSEK